MLQEVFDDLLAFASEGEGRAALAAARRSYEHMTGEIFEGDASFERRIAAFLEWYVLDALDAAGEPPIVHFAQGPARAWTPERQGALNAWRASRLSLFEVRRLRASGAEVTDLLTGGRHRIHQAQLLLGCPNGTVVLARLVENEGNTTLTDGILYLPQAARKEIRAAAKALRKAGGTPKEQLALVMRLAFFSNRCERYRHVDPRTLFVDCAQRA